MTKKKVLHVKPTAEELEAKAQEALAEADKLKNNPPEPEPKPEVEPKAEELPAPELEIEEPPAPEPDYKEKFKQSTKEAQILTAKNKKINEAFDKASNVSEPTEEEMIVEFPDWEMMSEFERKMATQTTLSNRRFASIAEVGKEFKDIEAWNGKVETFLDDPKLDKEHPDLVGKETEFKLFALKPTRRGVDFDTLVSSFLWTNKEARPGNKGQMFEPGTGGPSAKMEPKSDKITVEEARVLKNDNYEEWKRQLKAGKIDYENI